MKKMCVIILICCSFCPWLLGQTDAQKSGNVFYLQRSVAGAAPGEGPGSVMITARGVGEGAAAGMVYMESAEFGKPVTGAPYSATATTESTQVLADGNRIVNNSSAFVARDSQGRTRRDETMAKVGPWAVQAPKLSVIHDPVSGTDYILNANDQTAQVVKRPKLNAADLKAGLKSAIVAGTTIGAASIPSGPMVMDRTISILDAQNDGQAKTESLGTQVIAGVSADGKRVTRTIPAGQIGNERPIEITSEVWYSSELQTTVLSKRNDPRIGETVYQLTDIKRGEPDPSLFEVPAGYTTKEVPVPALPPLPPAPAAAPANSAP